MSESGFRVIDLLSALDDVQLTSLANGQMLQFNGSKWVNSSFGPYATTTALTTHINDHTNPHAVTAAQVGNTVAQWNANKLQGHNFPAVPDDGAYLYYSAGGGAWSATSDLIATSLFVDGDVTTSGMIQSGTDMNVGNNLYVGADATIAGTISGTNVTADAGMSISGGSLTITGGGVSLTTAGQGLGIKEGTNATMGGGTLASGTATITTSAASTSSRIFVTRTGGTSTNVLKVTKGAGSFTVSSAAGSDAGTFDWLIINPT